MMVWGMEHHVYFWLKEERKNEPDRVVFEKGLADLFGIDEVAGGMWGSSAKTPERPVTDKSFDYALSMEFDSLEQHNIYQEHPGHDVFIDAFKDWWDKVLVMDVG
jgi:hypothetical protein